MATAKAYNKNNAGVKRILREAAEMSNDPSEDYTAQPLEDNLFEWHCTMRGPQDTEFEGGLYHFRINLPAEYPFRPPSIIMLTPSGRFECGTKICISFTNYHEELWQPAWGVRTAIVALQGFFPLKGEAAVGIGAVEYPESERKRLATMSKTWKCPDCGKCNEENLPPVDTVKRADIYPDEQPKAQDRLPSPPDVLSSLTPESVPVTIRPQTMPETPHSTQAPSTPSRTATVQSPMQQRREVMQPSRPPILLDGAICALLVMVATLLYRRVF